MKGNQIDVTNCGDCPFRAFNSYEDIVCVHPIPDWREFTSRERESKELPKWCPLKEEVTIIRLKVQDNES